MKQQRNRILAVVAFFSLTLLFSLKVNAQTSAPSGTDVPRIISYQGQITSNDGIPMNGSHHITATLYSDHLGRTSVWQGSYDAEITSGLFSIQLGSGKYKLPDNESMNRPLWVGIQIDGKEEMQPLTQFAAAPYALNVPDKSITMAKLAPEVAFGIRKSPSVQSTTWDINGNTLGANSWLGATDNYNVELRLDNSGSNSWSGRVMTYAPGNNIIGGHYSNNIVAGLSCVIAGGGYRDGTPTNHPNTIGTYATSYWSFLGGGEDNELTAEGGFLGGGIVNTVIGVYSALVGGSNNRIGTTTGVTPGNYSFIGGGGTNILTSQYGSIVGGASNTISTSSDFSAILGGSNNTVSGTYSSILGGQGLTLGAKSIGFLAYDGTNSVSTGGNLAYFGNVDLLLHNTDGTARKLELFEPFGTNFTSFEAQSQSADIHYILPASLGSVNDVLALNGVSGSTGTLGWHGVTANEWHLTGNGGTTCIGDGGSNFLGTTDAHAFEIYVNQGDANSNRGDKRVMRFEPNTAASTGPNIIGGYQGNSITNSAFGSFIGGGGSNSKINTIASNFSVIGGGEDNKISFPGGSFVPSDHSFIGGGLTNEIQGDANTVAFCVIGGGTLNIAHELGAAVVGGQSNKADGDFNFVGGGKSNEATADAGGGFSTIVGGQSNKAQGNFSFIGGGKLNLTRATSVVDFQAVVGGENNDAEGNHAFVGGGGGSTTGLGNFATGDLSAVVGGSANNAVTSSSFVGGGSGNTANTFEFTTVAGGSVNTASGFASNIPGGTGLLANGRAQTVIGTFNIAKPSSASATFTNADPAFIVGGGGTDDSHRFNAFEVYPNGHSVVYQNNGSGATNANIVGATYNDNTLNAWAHWKFDNRSGGSFSIVSDHGIASNGITQTAMGRYSVTLNLTKPDGTAVTAPVDLCVTVTACDDGHEDHLCAIPVVLLPSTVSNIFEVDMTLGGGCSLIDHSFMMHVTGRY